MPEAEEPSPRERTRREFRRRGMFWALIWLAYLIYPLSSLLAPGVSALLRAVGFAGLVAFVAVYVWCVRGGLVGEGRTAGVGAAFTAALAAVLTRLLGQDWSGLFVFAATLVAWMPARAWAAAGILGAAAACVATLVWVHAGGGVTASLGITCALSGLGVMGLSEVLRATRALHLAQHEIARFAAVEERLRIARDVHDLLGHSLSVIVLKADLAGRLLPGAPERAAVEVADVRAVARSALADVREAVAGYRRPRLDEELARARAALDAAGIRCAFVQSAGAVPEAADALLGWAVREAATNVLRHSRAATCQIGVERRKGGLAVVVEDDGRGAEQAPARGGSGLAGLRERLAAAGGALDVGARPGGGFRLAAWVPLTDPGEG